MANSKGTPDESTPTDSEFVQSSLNLAVPMIPGTPPSNAIMDYDSRGTPILNPSLLTYNNVTSGGIYLVPFIIPNGWQYDTIGGSWAVNTDITPWWGRSAYNTSDASNFHTLNGPDNMNVDNVVNHSLYTNVFASPGVGFEDWTRATDDPNDYYINKDFNDVVFAYVTLTGFNG